MQIDYTAKRTLKAGHSVDTAYQFTLGTVQDDRAAVNEGAQNVALSGNTVTVVHRGDIMRSITFQLVTASSTPDLDDLREFLDSVKYGETFQIDTVDHILSSFKNPYREDRPAPGFYRFAFTARQL